MPSASVTVTNLDTGLVQSATADEAGTFEILALPIGPYSVTVSMPDQVEVLSGLTAGERVVVEGPPTLKDGDKVRLQ